MMRHADGSAGDADYGSIGVGYAAIRRPDPRIAEQFHAALGDARTVINVGAGAGSYEPLDRVVTAVEPSATMRSQRPDYLTEAVDATAQSLPFDDDAFDAAMASVTVHQWPDLAKGLSEMRRVASGSVAVLTFAPRPPEHWWLIDYAPELFEVEASRMPPLERIEAGLGGETEIQVVPIPADCTDRFGQALFARPEDVLDPEVRRAMSAWSFLSPAVVERAVSTLAADLESGDWDRRYGHFRRLSTFDGGMRLVIGRPA